ncbi:hypothetical protein ILYODFUR_008815, partial [Ilyodon furcidens]
MNVCLSQIHPLSLLALGMLVAPAVIGQEEGYTLDRSPVHHRIFLWRAEFMVPTIRENNPASGVAKQPQIITLPPS